jgi:hypothetical protein
MPSKTRKKLGLDWDAIIHTFLTAPLPSFPCCHHFFHCEDVDKNMAKAIFTQFMEHYHSVMSAIDTGCGPRAILSSLA